MNYFKRFALLSFLTINAIGLQASDGEGSAGTPRSTPPADKLNHSTADRVQAMCERSAASSEGKKDRSLYDENMRTVAGQFTSAQQYSSTGVGAGAGAGQGTGIGNGDTASSPRTLPETSETSSRSDTRTDTHEDEDEKSSSRKEDEASSSPTPSKTSEIFETSESIESDPKFGPVTAWDYEDAERIIDENDTAAGNPLSDAEYIATVIANVIMHPKQALRATKAFFSAEGKGAKDHFEQTKNGFKSEAKNFLAPLTTLKNGSYNQMIKNADKLPAIKGPLGFYDGALLQCKNLHLNKSEFKHSDEDRDAIVNAKTVSQVEAIVVKAKEAFEKAAQQAADEKRALLEKQAADEKRALLEKQAADEQLARSKRWFW